ncbi:unnamed protein product [marine sediment metagenome]|uniref:Uncharacterized protein n=1 Tax=marine sediment metagenome TaxID=412755 RepID=X0XDD5_9ZZZZ
MRYKLRRATSSGSTVEVSIPKIVLDRAMRRLGLFLDKDIKKIAAVWRFDSFEGLYLTFERAMD